MKRDSNVKGESTKECGFQLRLGKGYSITQDPSMPQNTNLLVIGASGSRKTRSIISPTILEAKGSYIISDPKGSLYKRYGNYLRGKGMDVFVVDFTHPEKSSHYNPFFFIRTELDILKVAQAIIGKAESEIEPFWDHLALILLSSLIAYIVETRSVEDQNFKTLFTLLQDCIPNLSGKSNLDDYMEKLGKRNPESFAYKQYKKVKVCPQKTFSCVIATVEAKIGQFDCGDLHMMMDKNETDFMYLGQNPAAIFTIISDTDRSLDKLASIFFTQAFQELTRYADNYCINESLPMPVRFILDDFATNLKIDNFPSIISSVRSRNISIMLAIQSEGQLKAIYGEDGQTIISNCDTVAYLGCNDIESAQHAAIKADKPVKQMLNLSPGYGWVFRRGEEARFVELLDRDSCEREAGYEETKTKEELDIQPGLVIGPFNIEF